VTARAGSFVEGRPGSGLAVRFPLNTSGGGISYCHPGPIWHLPADRGGPAVCAARLAAERQVANAEVALAHGQRGGNLLQARPTVVMRKGSVDE